GDGSVADVDSADHRSVRRVDHALDHAGVVVGGAGENAEDDRGADTEAEGAAMPATAMPATATAATAARECGGRGQGRRAQRGRGRKGENRLAQHGTSPFGLCVFITQS